MIRNPRIVRCIAVYLLIQFTSSIVAPSVSYALTSGPSQPEFSSFEPVATTNMVDEFSGDFTYNLPLLEVPGPHGSSYPISLSYHSGVTPEEEASWVGYGWTLNPGAINRGMRGLPDDYNGPKVQLYNKMPKNWTGTLGVSQAMEVFGKDGSLLTVTQNMSLRYNNYRGFGYATGIGMSLGKGLVSMGYNVSDGSGSFSLNMNPFAILSWSFNNKDRGVNPTKANMERMKARAKAEAEAEAKGQKLEKEKHKGNQMSASAPMALSGSSYGVFSYTQTGHPNVVTPYTGKSFNVSMGLETNVLPIPVGIAVTGLGSYSYQKNVEKVEPNAYGFMYSAEGAASNENLMDYHVEQEGDFNRRDVFLGIPFNDADNFMVTGEGLSGGFRLHNKTAGHFGPTRSYSQLDILNVGYEIGVGWTFGPGADVGKGSYELTATDWNRNLSSFQSVTSKDVDEPVFFRFNNDMGGEWGDNHDDRPFHVTLSGDNISLPANREKYSLTGERGGRSSYVGFTRNGDMTDSDGAPSMRAYSKDARVNKLAKRNYSAYKDLIGELAVYNESGARYVYGLPVYTQDEKSLSFSAKGVGNIDGGFIAYTNKPNEEIKMGEVKEKPYANTYLLTEITTADYVDRGPTTGASGSAWGPTPDDLGGYTYFSYTRTISEPGANKEDSLYRWRAPFRGMLYKKNSQSDPLDDIVSYSEGLREMYFLHYIETKTHVAFFKTSDRPDAREADNNASGTTRQNDADEGILYPKQLNEINLYLVANCSRDENGNLLEPPATVKPIKTVHLEYDNSLLTRLPNGADANTGKLTLKRVYFEYNGVKKATISPYVFEYAYPKATYLKYPYRYSAKGDDKVTEGYTAFEEDQENPSYSNFLMDPWGYYQPDGKVRFENEEPWVDQRKNRAVADFDPAAWNLKVIKLPSGGEIHVQYEQDDYSYVQDQVAHVMAKLVREGTEDSGFQTFSIDPASVGVTNEADIDQMVDLIHKRYVVGDKRIYFRFLYNLVFGGDLSLTSCNSDFISGYAPVAEVHKTSDKKIAISISRSSNSQLPRQICEDFVKSSRLGKVYPGADCEPGGMSDPDDALALANQLLTMVGSISVPDQLCKDLSMEHSYFRVPTPLAKKGGGIRVKRLMMYDAGLENDPVLYGSEYIYETKDEDGRIISSGVATNEPGTIREENILVDFVGRKGQNLWSKIVAGKDKEQSEGPLGESILPAPSVGYSRVIVKNIYSGKSNPGYTIQEFYTARDYPVIRANPSERETMTDIQRKTDDPFPLTLPYYTKIKNKISAVQGFVFILNSMHGRQRSTASFGGTYDGDPEIAKAVSSVQYEYFEPNAETKIPVMSSLYGGVTQKYPGREVDITFAQRNVTEISDDVNAEVDLQMTVLPPPIPFVIPFPTAVPSFSNVKGELRTHSTSKVVRYPAIVRKVTTLQNGIQHTDENLAFDSNTGLPIAVRSTDEFKGAYLTQTIPAAWEYPDMGGKWKAEKKRITGTFETSGNYIGLGSDLCNISFFSRGDLIRLGDEVNGIFYNVVDRDYVNNRLELQAVSGTSSPTGIYEEIVLVHTGRTNQFKSEAGSVVQHHDDAESLAPPVVNQQNRYDNETKNNFAKDLHDNTQNLTGKGLLELNGTYTEMDMSGFADKIGACGDLTNATVKNLKFLYEVNDKGVKIQLMAFDIICPGSTKPTTIKADGWE